MSYPAPSRDHRMRGWRGPLSSALDGVPEAAEDLLGTLDFTEWYNVPASPMESMTPSSFTNIGTGYLQKDVGAVAGRTYEVTIAQTRGAGACVCYLAESQGTVSPASQYGLEGGLEKFQLVAAGPWLTFRASVGATTTIVTLLSIVEVSV